MKALFFFFLFLFCTGFAIAQADFLGYHRGEWVALEIDSSLGDHLNHLTPDERPEQMRDWVILAIIQRLNEDDVVKSAFDIAPLRYDFQQDLEQFRFGETRWLPLKNGELVVLGLEKSLRKNVNISRAADEFRLIWGKCPKSIHYFEYQAADEASPYRFCYFGEIDVNAVFSSEFGYIERIIPDNERATLSSFLADIDDVVFVKKTGKKYTMGGRRFPGYNMKGVTIEDLGTIAQAGRNYSQGLREHYGKRGLFTEYENMIEQWTDWLVSVIQEKGIANWKESQINLRIFGKSEIRWSVMEYGGVLLNQVFFRPGMVSRNEVSAHCRMLVPYEKFEKLFIEMQSRDTDNYNFGFSLDHHLQEKLFAKDLDKILQGDTSFHRQWYEKFVKPEFEQKMDDFNEVEEGRDSILAKIQSLIKDLLQNGSLVSQSIFWEQQEAIKMFTPILSDISKKLQHKEPRYLYKLITFLEGNTDVSSPGKPDAVDLFIEQQINLVKEEAGILTQNKASLKEASKDRNSAKQEINNIDITKPSPRLVEQMVRLNMISQEEVDSILGNVAQDNRPDRETWAKWLVEAPVHAQRLAALSGFLQRFKISHTYQKARYDGDFRGTPAGMTMFYTDLVMKLWSINYKKSTPEANIPGFFAMTNMPVSSLYYENFITKNQTRSWLGLLENSYDVHNGNQLCFAHWSTRIFNASPNDLTPGVETEANVSSSRFANWWNDHFSQVADYELEYHRLNQLMKWTQIVFFMKNNGDFDYLNREPVRRDLDFETWYPAQIDLSTQVNIPFLNKTELGERVECLDVLQSENFEGFEDLEITYQFRGGVSLGKKGALRERMSTATRPLRAPHRSDMTVLKKSVSAERNGELRFLSGKKSEYNISLRSGKVQINRAVHNEFYRENATLKSKNFEWVNSGTSRTIQKTENNLNIGLENTGDFSMQRSKNAVLVSYKEGNVAKANRILRSIKRTGDLESGLQQSGQFDQIFKLSGKPDIWLGHLEGTNQWMKFQRIPKPGTDGFEFNTSTWGTWGRGDKYVGSGFIPETEASQIINKFGWQKIEAQHETNPIIELSHAAPSEKARKFLLSAQGKETDIFWENNAFFLRNNDKTGDVARLMVNKSGSNIQSLNREMLENPGSAILNRTPEGDIIGISENGLPPGLAHRFKTLTDGAGPDGIRLAIFKKNGTGVKVNKSNAIEMSITPSEAEANIALFICRRTTEQAEWGRVFSKAGNIEAADVEVLQKIFPKNHHFGDSYFEMQYKAGDLFSSEAILRYDHHTDAPQWIIRDAKGLRVENLTPDLQTADVNRISAVMRRFYEDPTSTMDVDGFLELTKPLASYLRSIEKSTNAQHIIVIEGEGLNSGLISNAHRLTKQFHKDVPNLKRSIAHLRDSIYPDIRKMIFVSTVSWNDKRFPGLEQMRDSLSRLHIQIANIHSISELKIILENAANQQIYFFTDTDQYGLLFQDSTFLYFFEFEQMLSDYANLGQRDFIYVLSRHSIEMESCISASGLFSYTITSQIDPEINSDNFDNLLGFLEQSVGETVVVKVKSLKKILKKRPDLLAALHEISSQMGNLMYVRLGQMNADNKSSFDTKLLSKIRGINLSDSTPSAVSVPAADTAPVGFPTVDKAIGDYQKNQFKNPSDAGNGKSGGKKPNCIKCIPIHKVHIDQPDPRIRSTC